MSPAEPAYREDPLGSGGYPAYRPADRAADRERERAVSGPSGSFPGYADDGPPVYRDSSPSPAYRDDPLGAGSYRDDPLGSGAYPAYRPADRDRAPDSAGDQSLPGQRNPGPYGDDPLGSGAYPAYRPADRAAERERAVSGPGGSFPGYADDGPPVYRDSSPPPAYRDDPLGSGAYPAYRPADRDRAPDSAGDQSLPGQRNPGPYGDDPLGLGYRGERPRSYRDDQYPPSYRDEPAAYPGEAASPYPGEAPGPRYTDDPFQSVYPDDTHGPGYPEDERAGSHPYGLPPGRPEPRAPRGRS